MSCMKPLWVLALVYETEIHKLIVLKIHFFFNFIHEFHYVRLKKERGLCLFVFFILQSFFYLRLCNDRSNSYEFCVFLKISSNENEFSLTWIFESEFSSNVIHYVTEVTRLLLLFFPLFPRHFFFFANNVLATCVIFFLIKNLNISMLCGRMVKDVKMYLCLNQPNRSKYILQQ